MTKLLQKFWKEEEAPTAVEYAIMVAGIAVVIIATVWLLGSNVNGLFGQVADKVKPQ